MSAPTKVSSDLMSGTVVSTAFRGFIQPGFNLANNTADAVNDIDFPAGVVASDETSPILMSHAAATAQLDVAYGTGNGGRFDSAISDGTWHCFIISNGVTTTRGFSKLLVPTTAPNYPAGYTHYRRVLSLNRVSGAWQLFDQFGDKVTLKTSIYDFNVANPGTAAVTRTLPSVPTGIRVLVEITVTTHNSGSTLQNTNVSPVGVTNANGVIEAVAATSGRSTDLSVTVNVLTNISGQIDTKLTASDANMTHYGVVRGWADTRGRT